jgi:hypothetical protein
LNSDSERNDQGSRQHHHHYFKAFEDEFLEVKVIDAQHVEQHEETETNAENEQEKENSVDFVLKLELHWL